MSRILVVEPSVNDAKRCQVLLEQAAFEVELCYSTADAVKQLEGTEVDEWLAVILLWDIEGPPPFAPELLVRCHATKPALPIIVTAFHWDVRLAAQAIQLGAVDCLLKPLEAGRLKDAVRRAVVPSNPQIPMIEEMRRTILGESQALLATLREVAKLIPHDERRILLLGESGTGKELIARAFHNLGPRKKGPCIAVNVSAIPGELAESVLFGHEKGAFTGATETHAGYLEQAGDGTLFLDEIGDLSALIQVKLLRAIQEREFHRIKGTERIRFRARLISATHRDLAQAANKGSFRLDLYHRVAEVSVRIPPLRERGNDIELLTNHFLSQGVGAATRLTPEARDILKTYPFHGNIRELENIILTARIRCEDEWILPRDLPLHEMGILMESNDNKRDAVPQWPRALMELKLHDANRELSQTFDRAYLQRKYQEAAYHVGRAAALAGVDRGTFTSRWKNCGLAPLNAAKEDSYV